MNRRWVDTEIIVQFRAEYYHSWPNAPAKHAYLASLHRHEIHFNVMMTQKSDRAIEFIELKAELAGVFSDLKQGTFAEPFQAAVGGSRAIELAMQAIEIFHHHASMETIAYVLAEYLAAKYGNDRWIRVVALEDGENGASYTHVPNVARAERDEAPRIPVPTESRAPAPRAARGYHEVS